jgi:hypothetical protein
MSKLIRVALYALSTKQGREILVSIIAALICAIVLPIILLGGFASTYFSVFDGEANDMYRLLTRLRAIMKLIIILNQPYSVPYISINMKQRMQEKVTL